jgi:protein-tyrosine phosphatase
MQTKIHWISDIQIGRLGVMPRPRGGDWLEDEILSLSKAGVDVVVSLLEKEEIAELELEKERDFCEANGIVYMWFPIPDRGVPASVPYTQEFINKLQSLLSAGKSLVIHCRQGIGRSAIIATCLLIGSGMLADEAFGRVAAARGCSVPDTQEQRQWVVRLDEQS